MLQAACDLAPVEEPTGLIDDAAHARLYSAGGNGKVPRVDARAGRVRAPLASGDGSDAAGFDPGTGLACASNGIGTLTVMNGLTVPGQVPTAPGARTMAVDTKKTHHVFLLSADFGPAPRAGRPHPRPAMLPATFKLIEMGNCKSPQEAEERHSPRRSPRLLRGKRGFLIPCAASFPGSRPFFSFSPSPG